MEYAQKLQELRQILTSEGLDGFIVPRTDEYQGEYVPACAERLAWLTGFTGSAGFTIVMDDMAVVMSDGRYTIQLAQQVDSDLYQVANTQEVKPEEWLKKNAPDTVIGYDPKLHTPKQIEALEKADIELSAVDSNLIDRIWKDKPDAPQAKTSLFSEKYAGMSARDKIASIQNVLEEEDADAVVLTMSDSIAWLLNIRGGDIPYIPVALSYAVVPDKGKVKWFVSEKKVTDDVKAALLNVVQFQDESALEDCLKSYEGRDVWLDTKRSSVWFQNTLVQAGANLIAKDDPCILPRACKTAAEQAAMKAAHVRDGMALVKFFKWFDEEVSKGQLTELFVEEKLESCRAQANEFKEPSFNTIAGYGAHGAIVHYRADEQSNQTIKDGSLLLLDSGAQYEDGTTDITRTMAVGDVSAEMKECNTLVLKGHIALASTQFKKGTIGKELDALARAPLQEKGLDYGHGTGHGVGCYLSVHEEAANFNPRGEDEVKAGMIISNEPGFYKEGEYGIRIENLVLTIDAGDDALCFETITLCPIDKNLIIPERLSDDEKSWFNAYHQRVYKTLAPLLNDGEQVWLKEATAAI